MKKVPLTPKRAEQLQREIYYRMSDAQKIKLTSDFYLQAQALKNSKLVTDPEYSRRMLLKQIEL